MVSQMTAKTRAVTQVVVTNLVSGVTSTVGTLSVQRVVRVVSTNTPTGNRVSLPIQLLAAGDENSLGFSLRFDPARLAFNAFAPNTNLPNLSVNVNTNQAAGGVLGLAAAVAVPQAWPLGTQAIASLTFTATTNAGNADITFADSPVAREVAGLTATPLSALFQAGTITSTIAPPAITQQPLSQTVDSGAVVVLTLTATGSLPMTFQWQKNGQDSAGGTNQNYVIVNAQPANAGAYAARVK